MPSSFLHWIANILQGKATVPKERSHSDSSHQSLAGSASANDSADRGDSPDRQAQDESSGDLCCDGKVHIAYRGVSDDRLYLAYNRKWSEVKFFRPIGLRVFCSNCRSRLL